MQANGGEAAVAADLYAGKTMTFDLMPSKSKTKTKRAPPAKYFGWQQVSAVDLGQKRTKCYCNRTIRHVHTVQNLKTGEQREVGSSCAKLYTSVVKKQV
tara:strand:+ start:142 stop:438 length:297 start_codon:yes stop_codon:yes gene_type:complete